MPEPDEPLLERWRAEARQLAWARPPSSAYDAGRRAWFPDGSLNVAVNCLDRHLLARGDRLAFRWEGEPGDRRELTYGELHREVCAFAHALAELGIEAGDRIAIYAGLIPETVIAMLACARLGAVHAVLPAALPPDALADRLADLDPKALITQDGSWRHGLIIPLKARADEAMAAAANIQHTVVVRRTGVDVPWYEGDRWYHDLVAIPRPGTRASPAEATAPALMSEHPLFIAYVANRRGRPTGIVHGSGGLLTYAAAVHASVLSPRADGVLWCAAEVGWVAVQTHGVYGPLCRGATSLLYEGMLDTPTPARAWELIEAHGVTDLATTPSIVRNLRRWEPSTPTDDPRLATLERIVTIGEPVEDDLRGWLRAAAAPRIAVADGWGQTELGGMVALTETPPGSPGIPDAGLDVVDERGRSVGTGVEGELVLRRPWPGTFVGIHNDGDGSLAATYWSRHEGMYATGDRARRERDGSLVFLGRIDPVVSISGQLVSLTEVRDTLLEHPYVERAEVVERTDRRYGRALVAFVSLAAVAPADDVLAQGLRAHVHERLGGLAQPRSVVFVDDFPDDIPPERLRQALRMLAAAGGSGGIRVSPAQLRAAASGTPRS